MAKAPDRYGRQWGDDDYGADFDSARPPKGMKPYATGNGEDDGIYIPEAEWAEGELRKPQKKPPKLKWQTLIDEGFTNERGSPQEVTAFKDLVQKAPLETLRGFLSKMPDDLRYDYGPRVESLIRKRLKGSGLSLAEDYTIIPDGYWRKRLGEAAIEIF